MNDNNFLFNATSLKKSNINIEHSKGFEQFCSELLGKIGAIISTKLRLCRIPADDPTEFGILYQQYALIAFEGKKSACLIEVSCNPNLNKIHWPQLADIETGKRLCINVVDWIDAFLLIKNLMALTEVADA
ncbi:MULTISPECIES: hypothetical protein [unclassified Gilliamella]|uniref:hypothetical protein n=1 Tax=unclassified Gilliamella TaxID=2685620 RepID=UPI001580FC76|nr:MULTISPECIES: hypothetical protein [unclassified Gilliamella]MCO6550698.1 hypothetical protein [Gilliamella sp.]NUE95327.1 hypothetical protein [Gilliamella sp. ESL0232]